MLVNSDKTSFLDWFKVSFPILIVLIMMAFSCVFFYTKIELNESKIEANNQEYVEKYAMIGQYQDIAVESQKILSWEVNTKKLVNYINYLNSLNYSWDFTFNYDNNKNIYFVELNGIDKTLLEDIYKKNEEVNLLNISVTNSTITTIWDNLFNITLTFY